MSVFFSQLDEGITDMVLSECHLCDMLVVEAVSIVADDTALLPS